MATGGSAVDNKTPLHDPRLGNESSLHDLSLKTKGQRLKPGQRGAMLPTTKSRLHDLRLGKNGKGNGGAMLPTTKARLHDLSLGQKARGKNQGRMGAVVPTAKSRLHDLSLGQKSGQCCRPHNPTYTTLAEGQKARGKRQGQRRQCCRLQPVHDRSLGTKGQG